jgi:hypothetical protein
MTLGRLAAEGRLRWEDSVAFVENCCSNLEWNARLRPEHLVRGFGETAFACSSVRVGWQGAWAWGSNPCRVVRLRPASDGFADSGSGFGETAFACQSVASVVAGLFT